MSKSAFSFTNQINLQTEVAILQKKILAFKPCYARLHIPAIMGNNTDNYIEVPMPMHLSITYGDVVIPKGTKLIIQAIAGNYNDIRIIGFYDEPKPFNFVDFIKDYVNEYDRLLMRKKCKKSLPNDYGKFPYDEIKR